MVVLWEGYGVHLVGLWSGEPLSAQSEVAAKALHLHGYQPTQLNDDGADGDEEDEDDDEDEDVDVVGK